MKYSLFLICLFPFLHTFAQQTESVPHNDPSAIITAWTTYAYIDGKRLDSLESGYATYDYASYRGISFDDGQKRKKRKDYLLTDSKGTPLEFENTSLIFMLNFFHYNHWEFLSPYQNGGGGVNPPSAFILKKQ